ncbi:MAG TPA: ferritin-like domain-containing protein [Terriglobales bacterium]|nr:ferritin-like domain-containing protein [Terriglobales bacterium]
MKKFISKNAVTSQSQSLSGGNPNSGQANRPVVGRRSFLKGLGATGALLVPATALLATKAKATNDDFGGKIGKGDASILRFLAAAEILESDLWEQYWELSSFTGTINSGFASTNPATGKKVTPTGGNMNYATALQILDGDMPQYILDNTDDEFSHANFLLAYLKSKGANTSDIDLLVGPHFRTLQGSVATGSTKKGRLTNLTKLTVDTSFWGRYRSDNRNPDLGDSFDDTFRAVPSLNVGQHTAIPRTDADANNADLIKAIAFTAGFHFAFIEIGGTSLYPSLAQRVKHPEVLRVVLSIGPTEAMHFQTWQDKAGNATPLMDIMDPINNSTVTFVDLTLDSTPATLRNNLIMPEPCPFLNQNFPICSIVRPTETKGAAMGALKALTDDGLFIGQTPEFMQLLTDLASDADAA